MAMNVVDIKEAKKKSDDLKYCVSMIVDDKIYKFKVTFDDVDTHYLICEYISLLDVYLFEVCAENNMEDKELAKKYFPYLGKYRLEGNFKATENYFVPFNIDSILKTLFSMYKDGILTDDGLHNIKATYELNKEDYLVKFIHLLFHKAKIELFNTYTLEELNTCLDFLDKISLDSKHSAIYTSLRALLANSKQNTEMINNLGLNHHFEKVIERKNKELTKKHN